MLQIKIKLFTPTHNIRRRIFLVLAERSMFKCLTPLALNRSGSTVILILRCWSLAKFGPFENQIKSIGITLDVIYLTSAVLGKSDFEGLFIGSNVCLIDSQVMLLCLKVKWTILLNLIENWLSNNYLSSDTQIFGNVTRFIDLTKKITLLLVVLMIHIWKHCYVIMVSLIEMYKEVNPSVANAICG